MRRFLFVGLVVLLLTFTAFAQAQTASGELKGTVSDGSDRAMLGVTIGLISRDTGWTREIASDPSGRWMFPVVSPGVYEVRVAHSGFVPLTRGPVHITVGGTVILDLQLEAAGARTEILLQEDAPVLEAEKSIDSDTITAERIDNLPSLHRNVLDFSQRTPSSYRLNLDGVAAQTPLSLAAVQEFQVIRADGGVLNMVSRSGTNIWHGEAFSFFGDKAMDARNPFAFGSNGAAIEPPASRLQAGFALGGPIRHDRTLLFTSYEGKRERDSRIASFMENTSLLEPSASQQTLIKIIPTDSVLGFPGFENILRLFLTQFLTIPPATVKFLQDNSGVFPTQSNSQSISIRVDHSMSSSNRLFGRFTFANTRSEGDGFGSLLAVSRGSSSHSQDYAVTAGNTAFPGTQRVNEFRFQIAGRHRITAPVDPVGPELTLSGFAGLGRDSQLPSLMDEKSLQLWDSFTVSVGRHVLVFGGSALMLPRKISFSGFTGGRLIFGESVPLSTVIDAWGGAGTAAGFFKFPKFVPEMAPYLAAPISSLQAYSHGLANVVQPGFGDFLSKQTNKLFSGHMEDRFRARSNLSLDFGFRYEIEVLPSPVHRDKNNIAPRFGFTYSPQSSTLIRGSYGIYFASNAPAIGTQRVSQTVLWSADAGLVNPYIQQYSLGVERQISTFSIRATYQGAHGVKLLRSRKFQQGNSQDNRVESSGSSASHGMALDMTKRFSRYYQFQATYVFAKAIDDTAGFLADDQAANQRNLRAERSLSILDQRHRLVMSGVFQSPFQRGMRFGRVLSGWTVAPILTMSSGHPFNVLLGFDANLDTEAGTDRPANVGRNTGKGPGYASFNLRLARTFGLAGDKIRVEAVADAYNLFNRVNFSGVNKIVGNTILPASRVSGDRTLPPSAPLAFTSALAPRQIQLGLKFRF